MKIEEKKFVTLSYVLTVDGEVADMATPESPMGFVFGEGFLLPAFETNIAGKSVGDEFKFTLTPEEGYGEANPQMIIELGKDVFQIEGQLEEGLLELGNHIPMMTADGMRMVGVVAEVKDSSVMMDFNHPMAGKTLNFTGKIEGVREATDADYPNMDAGCGCDDGCDSCGDDSGCGCGC